MNGTLDIVDVIGYHHTRNELGVFETPRRCVHVKEVVRFITRVKSVMKLSRWKSNHSASDE